MKVVILAGGYGTRISEESHLKPKPMIEIGGKPILWHIMKGYSKYGFNDFIICCGYKQHVIKEWFDNYYLHNSDITYDFADGGKMTVHSNIAEPWKVTLVDTGLDTMTGGRIKRIQKYVGNERFMLTYGDAVSDVNFDELIKHHENCGRYATLTATKLGQRFGILNIGEGSAINDFREKASDDGSVISGGFMVLEPEVFTYLGDDTTVFEKGPLTKLSQDGQLTAYTHEGYWQCMDTKRELEMLQGLWDSGKAPWKTWE